jgi:hypothetical protein
MRFDDIEVGLEYELKRAGRSIRVTALKTPEELRSRQRYRIRYEDGIKKGEVAEQPLRFIRSRWGKPPPSTPVETRTIYKPGPWPPTAGDSVLWPETTGDIEWTVIEVDVEAATAHIDGELRTPVQGLFMTGAATWPGGGVTGLSGHLAAQAVLAPHGLRSRLAARLGRR